MLWPLCPPEITLILIEYGPEEGAPSRSGLFGGDKNFLPLQRYEPRTGQCVQYIVQNFAVFPGNCKYK
jgi:hypothetical protein